MPQIYSSWVHCNGNLLAAVDLETTGTQTGYQEICQIAVVPLNSDLEPLEGVRPFYSNIAPEFPLRADTRAMRVHGLSMAALLRDAPSPSKVADMLREWFDGLGLAADRRLIPLAHNWAFESSWLASWLGVAEKDEIFHGHARDSMLYALAINDAAAMQGLKLPFNRVGLAALCKQFGVVNHSPHDALADCLAGARVYRELLRFELL